MEAKRRRGKKPLSYGDKMLKGSAKLITITRVDGSSVNCAKIKIQFNQCGHYYTATYRRIRERTQHTIWCPTCESESRSREEWANTVRDIPLPLWKTPGPISESQWRDKWQWLR